MTGTTISTYSTIGLNLTTVSQNPVVVTETGAIAISQRGYAIYGSAATAWTIHNYGRIAGTGQSSGGIFLPSGVVTNGSSSDHSASIHGTTAGVQTGSNCFVANFGSISGGDAGVRGGGSITNGSATDTSASISGGYYGAFSGSGSITNWGTIDGGNLGIYMEVNGSITNGSATDTKATILGGSWGVRADGTTAVTNFGTISSVYLQGNGTVANYGTVVGAVAIRDGIVFNGAVGNASATIGSVFIGGSSYSHFTNLAIVAGEVFSGGDARFTNGSVSVRDAIAGAFSGQGTVANFATIAGSVSLYSGSFTNGALTDTVALVGSVGLVSQFASAINFGTIEASAGTALALARGSTVTNAAGATISGQTGVQIGVALAPGGTTTLTNAGTIIGSGGTAIDITGGNARIVLQQSAAIEGAIVASGSSTAATLEMAAGTGSLASAVTNFSSIVLDAGANWGLSGTVSNAVAGRITLGAQGVLTVAGLLVENRNLCLSGAGSIAVAAGGAIEVGTSGSPTKGALTVDAGHALIGAGTVQAAVIDKGRVFAADTLTLTGAVSGNGSINILRHSELTVDGVLGVKTLNFLPGGRETLKLGTAGSISTRFNGFNVCDRIDLLGVVGTSAHFSRGLLRVDGPSGSVATLHFTGNYTSGFTVGSDHHGGTLIKLA